MGDNSIHFAYEVMLCKWNCILKYICNMLGFEVSYCLDYKSHAF